jgi:hypothetical protein
MRAVQVFALRGNSGSEGSRGGVCLSDCANGARDFRGRSGVVE